MAALSCSPGVYRLPVTRLGSGSTGKLGRAWVLHVCLVGGGVVMCGGGGKKLFKYGSSMCFNL